jgi:hypothetical protein
MSPKQIIKRLQAIEQKIAAIKPFLSDETISEEVNDSSWGLMDDAPYKIALLIESMGKPH